MASNQFVSRLPVAKNRILNRANDSERSSDPVTDGRKSTPASDRSSLPSAKKYQRYYADGSKNLTQEDRSALAVGEENHNLSPWTQTDLLQHLQDRKELLPTNMPKMEKIDTLATIEHDIKDQQRVIAKGEKKRPRLDLKNLRRLTGLGSAFNSNLPAQMAFAQSVMAAGSDHVSSPGVPASAPVLGRKFSFELDDAPPPAGYRSSMPEIPLRLETFGTPGVRQSLPLALPSSVVEQSLPSSGTTSSSGSIHQHNPKTTFDSFLSPHKSGKGEAFRSANNAKQIKQNTPRASSEEQYEEWFADDDAGSKKSGLKHGLRKMMKRRV